MTIFALEEYCTRIGSKMSTFRSRRVESAYKDLTHLAALAEEMEASIAGRDVIELAKVGKFEQASFVDQRHYQIVTLLKALYIFGNIFINIMLSEVMDKPRMSLNEFLKLKKHPLISLPIDKILPVYCIAVYRNKVIAHHDVRRTSGHISGPGSGQHRLLPFSEQYFLSMSKSSQAELIRLKSSYVGTVQELTKEDNLLNLLEILFYNIPIGEFGNINPDRKKIDRIAEEGGCKSMTRNEIIKAVDTFTAAIASSV